jgi:hypothetical protein
MDWLECVTYKDGLNENLKIFLLANLVQTGLVQFWYFSALSLLCAMHVFQHFSKDGFLMKKSFGCMHSHSCTASCMSSLDQEVFPPRASLSGPRMRKTLKMNVPDHLSRHTDSMWYSTVIQWYNTMMFWSDGWSQMISKEDAIRGTDDCGSLGRVMLYKWVLVIPE